MAGKKYELTGAEWQIIRVVWKNQPCAAPSVQEVLLGQTGWSYSTVKTMMDRMVAKGFLKTQRIRNLILYRSAVTKKDAQKIEVLQTLKRAFDGALTPMMQFLLENNFSHRQMEELKEMLKSQKLKINSRK